MIRFDKPCRHFMAVAGLIIILTTLVTASILLWPDTTLAQGGPDQAQPDLTPPGPPPPLDPPIQTPEPGQKITTAVEQAAGSDLEVIRFRPKLRIKRGQLGALSPKGDKPDNTGKTDYQKPPAGESIGPKEPYTPPDYKRLLAPQEWVPLFYEGFEGTFPGNWILEDFSDDGGLLLDRQWGVTDYNFQYGNQSVWPAAGGVDALDPWSDWYPDNLNSWMEYEFDFSNYADVFVSFGLWYDTEPDYDWVYFCISTDFENYSCDYWSGNSDGWLDQTYWLTSYAGYNQVWLAWTFETDETVSTGYEGPFVDEIYVWGDDASVTPTPTPTPDPDGQLIENGSFETGDLTAWVADSFDGRSATGEQLGHRPSMEISTDQKQDLPGADQPASQAVPLLIGVTDTTYVEGQYSAFLSRSGGVGTDLLYQTFTVPPNVNDLVLNLWFAMTTFETEVETDWFCMSLGPADFSEIWVDLGCTDATDASGLWQELVYTLNEDELSTIAGQQVTLFFELYNDGGPASGTAGWVDFVQVYAIGEGGGSSLDPNEPNNDSTNATNITCSTPISSTPISGTIGDALGGYDVDWFVLTDVASGTLEIDINADTKVPHSELDSVVTLYDNSLNEVAWNDDDGVSLDSFISFDNQTPAATFYITVESYSGDGSPDSFYDLTAFCAGGGEPPPTGGNELPPPEDTWTIMLYLNAEDPSFEETLTQYREDIEAFIGGKSSFLKVVILYDGPGDGDTTRYLVQPNGNYTDGVNRWPMEELNMGDPNTLINFITWAMDQYSAENYYLAIDDHGDGTYGISVDRTSHNDLLTPPEVYSALKSATHNGNPIRKIDIFDYEACLMGLAENAYDVREWVNYVVFFEQISWAVNTYPAYFSDLAATDTPLDVGQRIIERYYANALADNDGQGFPHTISLIDAGQMSAVGQAVSNFGNALQATGDQDGVKAARDASQAFANDDDATNPRRADYIDLWDLADRSGNLVPTEAAAVKTAVETAVVAERHASGVVGGFPWIHDGAHGLSIYYPPSQSSNAFTSYPSLYQMSQNGDWDNFLNWAVTGGRRGLSSARAEDRLITASDTFVFKKVFLPLIVK